jgi:hypothetical protein
MEIAAMGVVLRRLNRRSTTDAIRKEHAMNRWLVMLGGGALALVIFLNGIGDFAFAQDESATPSTDTTEEVDMEQAYLEALAASLGVTVPELESAMTAANLELIDLWAAQARDAVSQGGQLFPGIGGFGGPRGDRGDGVGGQGRHAFGVSAADLATFLGITEDEVRTGLQGGMTIVELAEANGKTYDELRAFLVDQATARIDERLQEAISGAEDASGGTVEEIGTPVASSAIVVA